MAANLTVDLFLSVDGWAGSEGLPGYFGYLGPELEEWITSELVADQMLLMGRKTFELLAGLPEEARDASWSRMTRLSKVVFSRTVRNVEWENSRVCGEDLPGEVRRLKATSDVPLRPMGSLSVARQLTRAGLVDRLRLMTFPLIAGESGREAAFVDIPRA